MLDGIEALLAPVEQVSVIGRATTGAEAVALAQTLTPELVIMDVNMPGMDGIAFTNCFKYCERDCLSITQAHSPPPHTPTGPPAALR